MFASITLSRGLRIAALFALGLTLAACARGAEDIAGAGGFGAGGAGTPGSTQDFTVNVGDRVFFRHGFDRSEFQRHRHAETSRRNGSTAIRAIHS